MQSFLPTRALGRLSTFLALAGLVTFTACQPDRGSIVSPGDDATDGDVPDAAFARSDGASGGNPAVWFLPPLVPDPSADPEFEEEKFNENLDVLIRIFECGASDDDCPATPGDPADDLGGAATVPNQHYQFDWHTPGGKAGTVFRAFVEAEGLVVGFLDIQLTQGGPGGPGGPAGGPGAAGSDADDNALVNAGSNAAIKVMIEEGVGPNVTCDVDVTQCQGIVPSSPTVDVLIELEDPDSDTDKNDFTLLIPEGTRFFTPDGEPLGEVTFTLEVCGEGEDLDADIKKVGPCYNVIVTDGDGNEVEVDLEDANGDPVEATVSICDLNDPLTEVNPPPVFAPGQQDLVSIIHFENGEFAEALQHVDPVGCDVAPVASASNFLGRFAQVVKDGVVGWLAPERALASSSLLIDTGGGGSLSNFRSGFRGGLMSMLVVPSDEFPTDANGDPEPLQALLGAEVTPSPIAQVVDANDEPVQGATVRFELVDGSGSTISASDVTTGTDGLASVDWTLDALEPDPHQLKVFAKGMTAGPEGTGGDNVLQPDAGNTFFGGLDLPGDPLNYGDDFCGSNECFGDPEWIIAESFTFEASADANEAFGYGGNGFGFIVPATGTFPANWNTLDPVGSGGDLGPGPFADANYTQDNTFGCALDPSDVNGDFTTAWSAASDTNDPSTWTYVVVEKRFFLPDDATALRVHIGIDNDVRVAVNGVEITGSGSGSDGLVTSGSFAGKHTARSHTASNGVSHSTVGVDGTDFLRHEGCPFLDDVVFDATDEMVTGAENVVTVLARDRGGLNLLGVKVTADVGG